MSLPFEKIHCKWRDVIHYEGKSIEDLLKVSFYMALCVKSLFKRIKLIRVYVKRKLKVFVGGCLRTLSLILLFVSSNL